MAPSAPRVSSSGKNKPPPLPVSMEIRRSSWLSMAALMALSLARPGQSSCLSITQLGALRTMFMMVRADICTPVATGWSCNTQGTP